MFASGVSTFDGLLDVMADIRSTSPARGSLRMLWVLNRLVPVGTSPILIHLYNNKSANHSPIVLEKGSQYCATNGAKILVLLSVCIVQQQHDRLPVSICELDSLQAGVLLGGQGLVCSSA